jgi:hypothetical protein
MRKFLTLSRRRLMKILVANALVIESCVKAFAVDKLAKTDVDYRDRPKGHERCDNCRVWLPPNGCKSVDGIISPRGWCVIWRSIAPNAEISRDEEEKLTKGDVAYQNRPRGGQRCDSCDVFQPPDKCGSVQGKVRPEGWCNIWRSVKKKTPAT